MPDMIRVMDSSVAVLSAAASMSLLQLCLHGFNTPNTPLNVVQTLNTLNTHPVWLRVRGGAGAKLSQHTAAVSHHTVFAG
jgi:hypothetical protein